VGEKKKKLKNLQGGGTPAKSSANLWASKRVSSKAEKGHGAREKFNQGRGKEKTADNLRSQDVEVNTFTHKTSQIKERSSRDYSLRKGRNKRKGGGIPDNWLAHCPVAVSSIGNY